VGSEKGVRSSAAELGAPRPRPSHFTTKISNPQVAANRKSQAEDCFITTGTSIALPLRERACS